jgi:hypothetical protein
MGYTSGMATRREQERLRARACELLKRGTPSSTIARKLDRSEAWVRWACRNADRYEALPADIPVRFVAAVLAGESPATVQRRFGLCAHTAHRLCELGKSLFPGLHTKRPRA